MKTRTGENASVCLASAASRVEARPLLASVDADVCVVGAGIAGMTTAYLRALNGHSVVVIDDGAIGSGETHHATPHLTNELDDRIHGGAGACTRRSARAARGHARSLPLRQIVADGDGSREFLIRAGTVRATDALRPLDGHVLNGPAITGLTPAGE